MRPAQRRLLLGAGLAALAATAYLPALRAGFVWDDRLFVESALIRAPDGLRRIWFSTEPVDYFPLVNSSLWLQWRLWGGHPAGYHALNVLLHSASSVLLWLALGALGLPAAWLGAAIFAVHPVNVESVAWVIQHKNTLPMVFYLFSIVAYLKAEDGPGRRGGGWYAASLLAFLAAMLGKPMVAPLPLLLLLAAWWKRGRVGGRDLARALPFFLVAAGVGAAAAWFQHSRSIAGDVVRPEGMASRVAGAGWAVWFYLGKAFLPVNLSFVYPRWSVDPASPLSWGPLFALGALFALLWSARRGWGRGPLFALGYFVAALLPVLGFVDIYFMRFSLVADHWQYLALAGPAALAAAVLAGPGRGGGDARPWLLLPAAALVATLGVLTWSRARVYRDDATLWADTLEGNPGAWLAHNNLGVGLLLEGRAAEAERSFREALRLDPRYDEANYNLAMALIRLGREEEAQSYLDRVTRVRSEDPAVHWNVGRHLMKRGDPDGAELHLRQALSADPGNVPALNSLGILLTDSGRTGEAIAAYGRALAREPDNAELLTNLGRAQAAEGRWEEALLNFAGAARLEPGSPKVRFNLGLAYALTGQRDRALAEAAALEEIDRAAAEDLRGRIGP